MNNTCYYFHNTELQSFNEALKVCSTKFEKYGFKNGRMYEPRNKDTFEKLYKKAEEWAQYPTLQLWIGLHDYDKEGEFKFTSDKKIPDWAPWARGQPNGGRLENCATTFIADKGESPEWFDRPCLEFERNGDPGHRFFCECHLEEENANDQESKNSSSKDSLKVDGLRAKLNKEIKACKGGECLKPVADNASTTTENIRKTDISSTQNPNPVPTTTEKEEGSNPELPEVDAIRANLTKEIRACNGGDCLKSTDATTTTDDINKENNEISDKKEAAQPLVQSDSPKIVPIEDSGRQFDGWSFFWWNDSYNRNGCNCIHGCQIL